MTSHLIHKDRPCAWVQPRQPLHASERLMRFGPVLPMEEPGLWAKIWGRK